MTYHKYRLPLHPGDLPRWTVAQLQTCGDNIISPDHEAPASVGVLVAADRVVVVDGDTVRPLCIPTMPCRKEGGGADSGEMAGQGEGASITTWRQTARFLHYAVICGIVIQTHEMAPIKI